MSRPRISLVCSTIGRPDAVERLLTSITSSGFADSVEFILVDQSDSREATRVLEKNPPPGPWRAVTSGRGASLGRNVGTGLASAPYIAYPDDNCWYPPETLKRVVEALDADPELGGISGKQVTATGELSMLRWLGRSVPVSRTNFLRTSICSTIFLRLDGLPSRAPFDEGIGVGSPGWRGAGEESDLLLRVIASGAKIMYQPDIHVLQDDDRDAITDEFVTKMLKYGVGTGHLWRRHRLPMWQLLYHAFRKLGGSAIRAARGDTTLAKADLAYLRGELAGWRGVSP